MSKIVVRRKGTSEYLIKQPGARLNDWGPRTEAAEYESLDQAKRQRSLRHTNLLEGFVEYVLVGSACDEPGFRDTDTHPASKLP